MTLQIVHDWVAKVNARGRAAVTLPARTRTAGYPNQRAHPRAHQEQARTLTHSTDRNDAPGLAYLARTGFFKPVHVKSLRAHALRSLIIARKKTGGPASDLGESDPRFGGRVREHNPSFQSPAVRKERSIVYGLANGSYPPLCCPCRLISLRDERARRGRAALPRSGLSRAPRNRAYTRDLRAADQTCM